MSTKKQMLQARNLIKSERYSEARHILKNLDNATARKWMAKLDEIDPFDFSHVPQSQTAQALQIPMQTIMFVLVALGFLAVVFFAIASSSDSNDFESRFEDIKTETAEDIAYCENFSDFTGCMEERSDNYAIENICSAFEGDEYDLCVSIYVDN